MNARHVTQEELSRYVVDALEPGQAEALEAHVAACPRCAAALTAEARVEVALHEVLPQARALTEAAPVSSLQARRLPRPAPWVLMAAAAALVLVCLPHAGRGPLPLPSGLELPGRSDGDPSALVSAASAPSGAGDEAALLCALSPASRALCLASQGPFCGPLPADESAP